MLIENILSIALPIVYIAVGLALVWLLVTVVKTLKNVNKTVDTVTASLEPTLANVEEITTSLKPTMARVEKMTESLEPAMQRVDPMVERVSLTVDAVNLEMMRVDQILEDVTDLTGALKSTGKAIDEITNAPLNAVSAAADKIRGIFGDTVASDDSIKLGQAKEAAEAADEEAEEKQPIAETVHQAVQANDDGKVAPDNHSVDPAYVTVSESAAEE